jgi:hypothetical protein
LTLPLAPLARPKIEGRFCVRGVKGTQAEEHLELERDATIATVERLLRAGYRTTTTGRGAATLVARVQAKIDREKASPAPKHHRTHPWRGRGMVASPGRDAEILNTHPDHGAPEGAPRSLANLPKAHHKPLRPPSKPFTPEAEG